MNCIQLLYNKLWPVPRPLSLANIKTQQSTAKLAKSHKQMLILHNLYCWWGKKNAWNVWAAACNWKLKMENGKWKNCIKLSFWLVSIWHSLCCRVMENYTCYGNILRAAYFNFFNWTIIKIKTVFYMRILCKLLRAKRSSFD